LISIVAGREVALSILAMNLFSKGKAMTSQKMNPTTWTPSINRMNSVIILLSMLRITIPTHFYPDNFDGAEKHIKNEIPCLNVCCHSIIGIIVLRCAGFNMLFDNLFSKTERIHD